MASRKISEAVIQSAASVRSDLISGSGDLAPSTNSLIKASEDFTASDRTGRNIRFGIREHAMGGDRQRHHPARRPQGVRSNVPHVQRLHAAGRQACRAHGASHRSSLWTHDSIFLGEDGPTHQPIEHIASLRAIPNLDVHRPADPTETAVAWQESINRTDGPSAIVLTRQGLPVPITAPRHLDVACGGYIRRPGSERCSPRRDRL